MNNYKEEIEKMLIDEEQTLLDFYEKRLAHLQRELEVKQDIGVEGFRKIEPTFEYEKDPRYLDHMMDTLKVSVEEEIVKVKTSINSIHRKRLQREEQKAMMEDRE